MPTTTSNTTLSTWRGVDACAREHVCAAQWATVGSVGLTSGVGGGGGGRRRPAWVRTSWFASSACFFASRASLSICFFSICWTCDCARAWSAGAAWVAFQGVWVGWAAEALSTGTGGAAEAANGRSRTAALLAPRPSALGRTLFAADFCSRASLSASVSLCESSSFSACCCGGWGGGVSVGVRCWRGTCRRTRLRPCGAVRPPRSPAARRAIRPHPLATMTVTLLPPP